MFHDPAFTITLASHLQRMAILGTLHCGGLRWGERQERAARDVLHMRGDARGGMIAKGSKRRSHFANGTSLVERVTAWKPGTGYTVRLSDMAAFPLHEARSEVHITPTGGKSKETWIFDSCVKHGPLGRLMVVPRSLN